MVLWLYTVRSGQERFRAKGIHNSPEIPNEMDEMGSEHRSYKVKWGVSQAHDRFYSFLSTYNWNCTSKYPMSPVND